MSQSKPMQRRRLVLVVEDQEINRDILGLILEDHYDVLYAEDGAEGIEMIRTHAEDLSIILLDLMMPVMDGFQVLEIIRDDESLNQIPVIVLTAEKQAELRALQMGAADFITKPFDMHEVILARVSRIIELCEGRELIRATEYDPLTHLYSVGFFFKYADQFIRFRPDLKMDAIELNIDRFHSVNDLNGREFGDKVLKALADEIRSMMPQGKAIACRSDADRFFVFCNSCQDYAGMLERLQSAMNRVSERVNLRLRMGVCPYTEGLELRQQFDRAKTACNMVRGSYRSHLMIYDDTIRQREMYQQALINDLSHGVEHGEFKVFYQPKYNIQVDPPRLSSAEALIRWQHPERGMISPGDFIPLFESNGLIQVIDTFVWEEVARQIADWRQRLGITIPVSVNLSRTDVFDPQLESLLLNLMKQYNLEPSIMKLEVTESAYTDDANQLISVINSLREKGFEIEMDDFGSGYSSLNMLSTLPIDVLKMDMKFIQNIEHNDKDFRLIQLILDIAKYLNVPVVAEGVETQNQMILLRDASCDLCQGYYFSRPLPADQFEQLLLREFTENRSGTK